MSIVAYNLIAEGTHPKEWSSVYCAEAADLKAALFKITHNYHVMGLV